MEARITQVARYPLLKTVVGNSRRVPIG